MDTYYIDRQYTVYGIGDPRTNELRYIGVTSGDHRQRYYSHMRCKRRIGQWMRSLRETGIKPLLVVLETGYGSMLEAERRIQHQHRIAGAKLLNTHLVLPIMSHDEFIQSAKQLGWL